MILETFLSFRQSVFCSWIIGDVFVFQMLSQCLLECHKSSVAAGKPLALKVFVSGRNRLENDGATALAAAFKVCSMWVQLADSAD